MHIPDAQTYDWDAADADNAREIKGLIDILEKHLMNTAKELRGAISALADLRCDAVFAIEYVEAHRGDDIERCLTEAQRALRVATDLHSIARRQTLES